MRFYAGVGSRKTPEAVLQAMTAIAQRLQEAGFVLRSGAAMGADTAFERGAGSLKEIFRTQDSTPEAEALAARYHPAWNMVDSYSRKLHGRNVFQILGKELHTPVEFVVCWTPDGCRHHNDRTIQTGGTGTAISIASDRFIPVYNLKNKDDVERVRSIIHGLIPRSRYDILRTMQ